MKTRYERMYEEIKNEINEIISDQQLYETDSEGFGHLFLKLKLNLNDNEISEILTDGYNDNGIDGIYFENKEEKVTAHFFQFKFPAKSQNMNKGTTEAEVLKLFDGFKSFTDSDEKFNQKNWNDFIKEKRIEFKYLNDVYGVYDFKLWNVRFTIQKNSNTVESIIKEKVDDYISETGNKLEYKSVFVSEILSMYENTTKDIWPDFKLSYKKNLSSFSDEKTKITNCYVSLESIYESISKIEDTVYEGNVRYLNMTSKINENIKMTLKDEPQNFHLLNNGITIVCKSANDNTTNEYIDIKSGSIINGAQTVGTILSYLRDKTTQEREKFKKSFILVRIVEFSKEKGILEKMVYTLNTQNPMKTSYAIANEKIMKNLQQQINNKTDYFLELKNNEFNFEKKNNEKFNKMSKNKIDIETLIQTYVAFYNIKALAHVSKSSKASLFSEDNIGDIITSIKFEESILSYESFVELMMIIKEYRAYRKNNVKKEILSILNISESEIDEYRFLNTANYLILFALGIDYKRKELFPKDNIVKIIKKIKPLFEKENNISNATKAKETFDKVASLLEEEEVTI